MWRLKTTKMEIKDNTNWETNPCIWIEDGDIEINIEKETVEIEWNFNGTYEGGGGRMEIDRKKFIELLSKINDV